jgi:hypothetical protein
LAALALTAGGACAFDTALSGGPPAGFDALGAGKLQLQALLTTYDPNVRLGAACLFWHNTPARGAHRTPRRRCAWTARPAPITCSLGQTRPSM